MTVAPISVCMIVRNEQAYLEKCLSKIRPYVAEICIVDTGSRDHTPEIAKKYADIFQEYYECNENNDKDSPIVDFSKGRNYSFSLATQPWVMWLDGDDEFVGVERLPTLIAQWERVQKALANGKKEQFHIKIQVPYEHHAMDGSLQLSYLRERIVSHKDEFEWRAPVHEALCEKGVATIGLPSQGIAIVHRKRESGKASDEKNRNIRILEYWLEKTGELEPRMMYYLGREYMYVGRINDCQRVLSEYIQKSHFEEEKGMALMTLFDVAMCRGDFDDALNWSRQWICLQEDLPEAYFAMAKAFYFKAHTTNNHREWQRCAKFADIGFACDQNKKPLFFDPARRNLEIYFYYIRALGFVGRLQDGLNTVNQCLERYPLEPMFTEQKKFFVERLSPTNGDLGIIKPPPEQP